MGPVVRLLWASPLPPVRSGVSDYAVELLPELARLAEVRVVVSPGAGAAPEWRPPTGVELVEADAPGPPDEITLVHLGNNPYHLWLLPLLQRPRVVVVAHDLVLHHLLVESTLAEGDEIAYARLVEAAHGAAGRALADGRRQGFVGARDPFLLPARKAFLDGVEGVVVHSRWAAEQVRREEAGLRVGVVPLPVADPGPVERDAERARLAMGDDELLLMHLGFLTPAKGLREIVEAVAAARRLGVPTRLVLVGEGRAADGLGRLATGGVLEEGVVITTGWVDAETMRRLPAGADLGVVLRTPSAGETSAAVLRFLAAGTPVAVSGLHQFLEWPELVAPRVTPGPSAVAELVRVLERTWRERSTGAVEERRRAARAAWEDGHQPEASAAELVRFLESLG